MYINGEWVDAAEQWAGTTPFARADLLLKAWQVMTERSEDLAALMTAEQGKPLGAARTNVFCRPTHRSGSWRRSRRGTTPCRC
ncbi:hypothetical protein BH24ACT15_BH24ACT15_12220 [soil metagenome]